MVIHPRKSFISSFVGPAAVALGSLVFGDSSFATMPRPGNMPTPEKTEKTCRPESPCKGLHDFGKGKVMAHRHLNLDGSIGGWVAGTAEVGLEVFVAPQAQVSQYAIVHGPVRILDKARVSDYANVNGKVEISGKAVVDGHVFVGGSDKNSCSGVRITGSSHVTGHVMVLDNADIKDRADLRGHAIIRKHGRAFGQTQISDYVIISGPGAWAYENSKAGGHAKLLGFCDLRGHAQMSDHAELRDNGLVEGEVKMEDWAVVCMRGYASGRAHLHGKTRVYNQARVLHDADILDSLIGGWAEVGERAKIRHSWVYGRSWIYGDTVLDKGSEIYSCEISSGKWSGLKRIYGTPGFDPPNFMNFGH